MERRYEMSWYRPYRSAGSGLLAAAFLQPAVAFADDYNITPDPTATEEFLSLGGQPPFDQTVAGLQDYNSADLATEIRGRLKACRSTM
jgi:hypothetical protein